MNIKDAQERQEETMMRRLLMAVFVHARLSSGKFGDIKAEVKIAREIAEAVMKEPKA